MMNLPRTAFLFLAALTQAGCSAAPEGGAAAPAGDPFAAPSHLAAELVDGHVDLRWRNNGSEQTGSFLEFNMNPGEPYGILEILPLEATSHRHPNVAPETRFGYRVRPYFGRASDIVEVATGAAVEGGPNEADGQLPPSAAADPAPRTSLRAAGTLAKARPLGLTAGLLSSTIVDLRWQDRAGDEEGYLVDMNVGGGPFRTIAMLPPDATSFRKVNLPPQSRVGFRVRAYFLGTPSDSVTVVTPPDARTPPPAARPLLR